MGMKHSEKIEILEKWKDAIQHSERTFEKIKTTLGLDVNGPLVEMVGWSESNLTDIASLSLGDTEGWLAWYWLENDMGKKGLQAGKGAKVKKIKTLTQLLELIDHE
jgi:hypothetical protein